MHAYNPTYSGGRGSRGLRLAWGKHRTHKLKARGLRESLSSGSSTIKRKKKESKSQKNPFDRILHDPISIKVKTKKN
jgi:hypothetical protein